jgi:tetratricopeptide (TPR) repeat protein
VAKRRFNSLKKQFSAEQPGTPKSPAANLTIFIQQKKYRQAIDEVNRLRRLYPDLVLEVNEAELWLKRGNQEFEQNRLKDAESSFRRAVELGEQGEAHYWLSRCLVAQQRHNDALAVIQPAFEKGSLPKDYRICYLKLLLLNGDFARVQQLVSTQAKQFSAPQLHWARGVLALQAQKPAEALTCFQKIKKPLTPGDLPDAWRAYTQQQAGLWEQSAIALRLPTYNQFRFGSMLPKHPVLAKLCLYQWAVTGKPRLETEKLEVPDPHLQDSIRVCAMLQLIEAENPHDAAHLLLRPRTHFFNQLFTLGTSGSGASGFPELDLLRPNLLLLAGQQCVAQGAMDCAEQFFEPLLDEKAFRDPAFNPKLAMNGVFVFKANDSDQKAQQLLSRLIRWLEEDAKKHPQKWPAVSLKPILAHLHCKIADCWMNLNRARLAKEALQRAEQIDPQSPEVIGRRGLQAMVENRRKEAVPLLTQALEKGCMFREVYEQLVDVLDEQGDRPAKAEIRRQFGKRFGDLEADLEEFPIWNEALSTQRYLAFEAMIQTTKEKHAAVRACRIFIDAVTAPPKTPTSKVPIDQTAAIAGWEALLSGLAGEDLVETLQTIALAIVLYAKRDKGIAALATRYMLQLFELQKTIPTAILAHLIVLSVKDNNANKLQFPLQHYLANQPQPGNALAELQFKLRRFGIIYSARTIIEKTLEREPQNPLLLLAYATTWQIGSSPYEKFHAQGFELARRLQDAKALQAFRQEQAFVDAQQVTDILPSPKELEDLDFGDMEKMIENMIRKTMRGKASPGEIERALPTMKSILLNSMMGMDDEDDLPDLDAIFGLKPPKKGSKARFFNL